MLGADSLLSGPILLYAGEAEGSIHLAALVVTDGTRPPALRPPHDAASAPTPLQTRSGRTLWRYRFAVSRGAGSAAYAIGDRRWTIRLPGDDPLRIAFTACNGNKHNDDKEWETARRNALWRDLARHHARRPFHLLIQGGDQLYADDVWQRVPALAEWARRRDPERLSAPAPEGLREEVAAFYFDRYCRLWSQADLAPLLASVPQLMMWDDHDIFDGWGSHPDAFQQAPTVRCVWEAAREQFALFQLGALPEELPSGFAARDGRHFGWAFRLGNVGLIAPDLRSQRTQRRVLGRDARAWLTDTLEEMAARCDRVLLLSTVPLVNLNLSLLERLMVRVPGQQDYQDDLRDQWRSYAHGAEWRGLVRAILQIAERADTPVTVLSGEIHMGARGRIEGPAGTRIDQLISSGIAHYAPPEWLARAYDVLARGERRIGRGARLRIDPLPGLRRRYLAARNWLALDCHADGRLIACWHAEGDAPAAHRAIELGAGAAGRERVTTRSPRG